MRQRQRPGPRQQHLWRQRPGQSSHRQGLHLRLKSVKGGVANAVAVAASAGVSAGVSAEVSADHAAAVIAAKAVLRKVARKVAAKAVQKAAATAAGEAAKAVTTARRAANRRLKRTRLFLRPPAQSAQRQSVKSAAGVGAAVPVSGQSAVSVRSVHHVLMTGRRCRNRRSSIRRRPPTAHQRTTWNETVAGAAGAEVVTVAKAGPPGTRPSNSRPTATKLQQLSPTQPG